MSAVLNDILPRRATYRGLSSVEAEMRLKEYGFNRRESLKRPTWFRRLFKILAEPMIALLVATGIVYLVLGDTLDALVVFISFIPVIFIELVQQRRTDEAIAALDKLLVEYAKVYRDSQLISLETKYIVPGDLVFLAAGDKVTADGVVWQSPGLLVDESIMTGESSPVPKAAIVKDITNENKVAQGTLVVQGEGIFLVTATGADTEYGKLGSLLERIEKEPTPLQKKIHRLVKGVALAALMIAGAVGVMLGFKYGLSEGVLGALTIAISIIPEEFPIVFSVFLVMGVWRLSKEKALIRETVMVETLGAATVIGTDKTGTLTEGTMAIRKIYYDSTLVDIKKDVDAAEEKLRPIIQDALLALEQVAVDPLEVEVQRFAAVLGIAPEKFFNSFTLEKDGFFDAATKLVHHTWRGNGGACFQYTAGAPEYIIARSNLSATDRQRVSLTYQTLAQDGFRVIGIAKTPCSVKEQFVTDNFEFRGLIAMSDPPRRGVAEAIRICQEAGIKVMMITGDNAYTARAIADQIGLTVKGAVVEGDQLERLTSAELKQLVRERSIFVRVKPEQKYLIIEALQANGEVVGMTGDGVNDAPALKKATIGIAMGERGTEVARAAAGIVLLDDNFVTIVNAIKEGRRIYDNLRRAFSYLLSFHIPIVGLSFFPLLLGRPLFFFPVHIIFLELFCDPAVVLGFERSPARRNLMRDAPRPAQESLIPKGLWLKIIIQGMGILAISFALYYYFGIWKGDIDRGRTTAFAALVMAQILLVIITHEWRQLKANHLLMVILLLTAIGLALLLFIPLLRTIFHFVILSPAQYGLTFISALFGVGIIKLLLVLTGGKK